MKKFISSFSIGMFLAGTFFPIVVLADFGLEDPIAPMACVQKVACTARTVCGHGVEVCVDIVDPETGAVTVCSCSAPGIGGNDCGCH